MPIACERAEVEVEHVLGRGLEDHLVLEVVLEAERVLAVAAVGRPDARLDVRGLPRIGAEAAEERRRVGRSRTELGVVRLHDRAALPAPVRVQRGDQLLVVEGRHGTMLTGSSLGAVPT